MAEFHPAQELKQLRETLKKLPPKKRMEHLWIYYKWVLGVLAFFALIAVIVVTGIQNVNTENLISGELVNVYIYEDGMNYLNADYFEKLQGIKGKQRVNIIESYLGDFDDSEYAESNYYVVVRTVAAVAAQELDYMMMDERSLSRYLSEDLFIDLNELFTPQELVQMEDDLIYLLYEETGIRIPVAINIKESGYAKKYIDSEKATYIAFIANTTKPEACRAFWDYLMECKAE